MSDLRRFPRRTLRVGAVLHRIHRVERGPWWFSADGSGRFDPVGVGGMGCCYLAERALGAWVEVFRRQTVIAEADVHARRLLSRALGREVRLADVTSWRALQFGVSADISAGGDYAESQRLAAAITAAGFDGVRYLLRHDPRQRLYGVALFGPAGSPDPTERQWPRSPDAELSEELLEEAARVFGYRVVPTP